MGRLGQLHSCRARRSGIHRLRQAGARTRLTFRKGTLLTEGRVAQAAAMYFTSLKADLVALAEFAAIF